jgi:hypothetical protein
MRCGILGRQGFELRDKAQRLAASRPPVLLVGAVGTDGLQLCLISIGVERIPVQ